MNKAAIIRLLTDKYTSFINTINGLTEAEYQFSDQDKWTAGQQLQHLVLCVKPLVQVFSMGASAIAQNFGVSDRPGLTYEALLISYLEKLNQGGKAPDRYVPPAASQGEMVVLTDTLSQLIESLCGKIENFSEASLDSLYIPHPLLGKLTLREMLYNTIYHAEHHEKQV
ncbi:MAG TPA: DinB family protein, partial [Chitinophagales bacterium]|nr:DinB family protein [Chitinophagales bacterium]